MFPSFPRNQVGSTAPKNYPCASANPSTHLYRRLGTSLATSPFYGISKAIYSVFSSPFYDEADLRTFVNFRSFLRSQLSRYGRETCHKSGMDVKTLRHLRPPVSTFHFSLLQVGDHFTNFGYHTVAKSPTPSSEVWHNSRRSYDSLPTRHFLPLSTLWHFTCQLLFVVAKVIYSTSVLLWRAPRFCHLSFSFYFHLSD